MQKKPKLIETMKPYDFHLCNVVPHELDKVQKLDGLWVVSHSFGIRMPMWVEFNAKIVPDTTKKQIVSYLTPINQSLTDSAVVLETMLRAMTIPAECNEQYAQVTYDLGIAKIAMQLQSTEKEEFKNLFIHLGTFHIEMAFFQAVGSFLDGCGLSTIMIEAGLIGSGSVNTFLNGKHFNRCKRLHIIVALALQMQELQYFVQEKNITINDDVFQYLQQFQSKPLEDLDNENVRNLLQQFQDFHKEILNGLHGKTMQLYAIYIQLIHYYLLLERSIRTVSYTHLDVYKRQK